MSDRDHLVVAGSGRVGRRVAESFATRGYDVTVVEKDSAAIDAADASERITYVEGDATRPSRLRQALTDRTNTLGALTDDQAANLAICMAATRLRPDIETVARIEAADGDEYTEFVDRVYFPERASIRAAVNALTGSNVRTLEGVTGDLELLDVRVDYDAPAAGSVVEEVLPEGSLVIAEASGDVTVQHSTTLVAGRRYLVAADNDVVAEVIRQFRGDAGSAYSRI
ncbi:MAG: TrkA family potassium uptake protein [Haloplanus sp.]